MTRNKPPRSGSQCHRTLLTAVAGLALFVPGLMLAQTFQASVSGIVVDASGAVVPKVKVTVTDTARGVAFTNTSNQDGVYLINNLIPSTYRVTAEAAGFSTYQMEQFPLTARQEAVLNITLQLGTTNQTLEVGSQVQMVDPSNATLGGVVNNKSIVDLPIINRNVLTLMAIQPGVQPSTQNNYSSNFFTSAIRYSFNGGLESTSDFQQDGISILNQSDIPGIMGLTMLPSVDAVDDMRVQTNGYAASYGRSGGGITTMVTKSGTNQIHGSAFDFIRNNGLNSNNFFSNRAGAKIAPLHQHQYGVSVGGPIIKNRTFFFGLLERNVNNAGAFALFTVPTAAMRGGDFSRALNAAGQLKTIFNPYSTTPDAANAGQFIRTPFPGNIIPASLIDPVGAKAVTYWPEPNSPGLTNNVNKTAVSANPLQQVTSKIDHNISTNKRVFGRYGYLYNVAGSPNFYNNLADTGFGPMTVHAHNLALGYTQTLGASSVLELRVGVNRFSALRPSNGLGFKISTLGLPASAEQYLQQGDVDEFPGIATQGYSLLGNNNGPYYESHELDYIFSGSYLRVIGKHSLTVGAEHRDYFLNFFQTNPLLLNFGASMSQGPNPRVVSSTAGDGVASLLLGAGDSGSAGYYARTANANHYNAQFIQDDIKWNRKLTINLGFRFEEETGTTERFNRMAAIDPFVLNPISAKVKNPFNGQTPWNLYGGYVFAGTGDGSLGRRQIRGTEFKPSPRIGLAYALNDKTVIRASYGMLFGVPYAAATRSFTSGLYQTATPWVATVDGVTVNAPLRNPFPNGYFYPPGSSQGLLSAIGQGLSSALPSELHTLYNQQWNFSIQRSLANNALLQVAYVGNKGTHLFWGAGSQAMNQLAPQFSALGNQLLAPVENPFFGLITTGPLAQPTVQYGQLLRPFPAWQNVGADGRAVGNSEYQALQTSFTKRYSNGVSLIAGYTWAKLMTDVADGTWAGTPLIRSFYCARCEHSPSTYDVPHRFTFSFVGELPFGRGKMFGNGWNRPIDAILGGWQTNGILTLAKGVPLVFSTAANTSFTFGGAQHPNVVGDPVLSSGKSIYQWFNTAAFAQPANFTSGNLSRTYTGVRADTLKNLDFSLFKNFTITERFRAQLRAEAFNVANHPVFGGPGVSLNGVNFGVVTGQSNPARNIQLALKVLF